MTLQQYTLLLITILLMPSTPLLADPEQQQQHSRLMFFNDSHGNQKSVRSPEDWDRRRHQILTGMQLAMGNLPCRTHLLPLDVQITETVDEKRFQRLTVTLATDESNRVPAFLYLPKGYQPRERGPAVLALHQTVKIGKREVDGQGTADQGYARELADRGYIVLAPDYPSFGDYACDFTDPRFASGTIQGVFNHMRCVDFLQSREEVDPQRIGVIGHSLGGHNALFLAVFDERIKAVVSSCGWTPFHDDDDLPAWAQNRYMPRLRQVYALDPDRFPFDFYEVVAALAPRAFMSISPRRDRDFAVTGVEKAIPLARQVYELLGADERLQVRYPDCSHSFPEAERRAAYEFLDCHLKHIKPKLAKVRH